MKKIVVLLIVFALISVCFIGCNKSDEDFETIDVVMPDGAPALTMAKLMYDNPEFEGYEINFEIVQGAPAIQASVLDGDADIAVLPTNMAANLYNQDIDIQLVSSNIFGLLYMLGNNDIQSLDDLKGEVIHCLGEGQTPDFVFKTILDEQGYSIGDDTPESDEIGIVYEADSQSIISKMLADQIDYAILGEPQATQAVSQTSDMENPFSIQLNLQEEWQNGYPQVSTIAKTGMVDEHSEFLDSLLNEMENNTAWITENSDLAMEALEDNDSNVTGYDADTIARCNIRLERAENIQEEVESYLQLMYNFNENFVGGSLPDEGFYR